MQWINEQLVRLGLRQPTNTTEGRQVFFPDEAFRNQEARFIDNSIKTARYNLIDFFPKQLFVQFSKVANLYFLLIGGLQQVPNLSPTGQYTTIGPLFLFVAVSMAREAYDDVMRHRQDIVENNLTTQVWKQNAWMKTKWHEVKVGDIVKVVSGQFFPADIILLHSSHENGVCYIETSSLDGESNLKEREALAYTQEKIQTAEAAEQSRGYVRAEQPNSNLYVFDGYLNLEGSKLPLTANQLLLRGASLQNTTEIIGIVVFTGEQTKVRLNATPPPTKSPSMEAMTNRLVITIFGALIGLAVIFTVLSTFWDNENRSDMWYLLNTTPSPISILTFFTFLILFNTLIPISLYVTLEVVKVVQAALINVDEKMYHAQSQTYASARTSSINEELGQISYLFTDKTGTLTDNIMLFRKCSVASMAFTHHGVSYNPIFSDVSADIMIETYNHARMESDTGTGVDRSLPSMVVSRSLEDLHTESTTNLVKLKKSSDPKTSKSVNQFLLALSLCHTIVPVKKEDGTIEYQGSSPDEVALVVGAAQMGHVVLQRRSDHVTIQADGVSQDYTILHVLEFTSERKRMSVIYRFPDGSIVLFCKGADAVILSRLKKIPQAVAFVETTQDHINSFAKDGLRTLAYAMIEIPPEQYEKWKKTYVEASIAMVGRQEKLVHAADLIEWNMILLGATAIEDKLQLGVPETIHSLTQAGIKLWVLTGDKLETAVNVGYSSALIHAESQVFTISKNNGREESVQFQLKRAFSVMAESDLMGHFVLVVDGPTLEAIFADDVLLTEFLSIGVLSSSVICCRVSPIQKADVVKAARTKLNKITLAIGDGANDISMIQAAHVGVGITGREGLQAARSSDYTLGQFRFLQRLLLVHGHWSYVRVSKFLLGSFYKCMAFYLTQAIFQAYTGFTGTSMYEQWTLACYNVFFALLPVIFIGIFEKDLEDSTLLAVPQLYRVGRLSLLYNFQVFWTWMAKGIYHALILTLIPFYLYGDVEGLSYNNDDGLYLMGTICYTGVIFVVTFKIGFLEARYWSWPNVVVNIGTIAIWFFFMFIYSMLLKLGPDTYGVFDQIFGYNSKYLLTVLLVLVAALLPDLVIKYISCIFFPSDQQIFSEIQSIKMVQQFNEIPMSETSEDHIQIQPA